MDKELSEKKQEDKLHEKKEDIPTETVTEDGAKVTINVIKKEIKEKITFWDILGYVFWLIVSLIVALITIIKFDIIKDYPFRIGYIVLFLFVVVFFSAAFNFINSITKKLNGVLKYLFLITVAIVVILIIILHAEFLVLAEELLSPLIELLMIQ